MTNHYVAPEQVVVIATWLTIPAIAAMVGLGYSAARRFFAAAPAPVAFASSQSAASAAGLDAWRPPLAAMPAREPFRISLSSLVWQSVHSNLPTLGGLVLTLLIGVISLALIVTQSGIQFAYGTLLLTWVLAFLSVSWLGVFAFAGDGSSPRLRFLAERGISPTLVWWTRHIASAAIIVSALLIYYSLQRLTLVDGYSRAMEMFSVLALAVLALAIAAVCVYGVSQWVSQMIRTLGGTAFLGPLLAAVTMGWLVMVGGPLVFTGSLALLRSASDESAGDAREHRTERARMARFGNAIAWFPPWKQLKRATRRQHSRRLG